MPECALRHDTHRLRHAAVFLLSLSVACLPQFNDTAAPEDASCEAGSCPIDACADGDVQCCIAAHGRGLDADAAATLAESCVDPYCDAGQYLSEAAAVCIAQVYGLEPGVDHCGAGFEPADATGAAFEFQVHNVTNHECVDGGWWFSRGQILWIDAISGELNGEGSYIDD